MVTEDLSLPIESNLLEIVVLILLSKNGRSLFPESLISYIFEQPGCCF